MKTKCIIDCTTKQAMMKLAGIVRVNLRGKDTYGMILDQSTIVTKEKNVSITIIYVDGELWKQTAEISRLSWKRTVTKELLQKAYIPAFAETIGDITGMADWVF